MSLTDRIMRALLGRQTERQEITRGALRAAVRERETGFRDQLARVTKQLHEAEAELASVREDLELATLSVAISARTSESLKTQLDETIAHFQAALDRATGAYGYSNHPAAFGSAEAAIDEETDGEAEIPLTPPENSDPLAATPYEEFAAQVKLAGLVPRDSYGHWEITGGEHHVGVWPLQSLDGWLRIKTYKGDLDGWLRIKTYKGDCVDGTVDRAIALAGGNRRAGRRW
jgi:hypothetical protein